jgi:acetyl-CoA carboxylase carboxyltransferase component
MHADRRSDRELSSRWRVLLVLDPGFACYLNEASAILVSGQKDSAPTGVVCNTSRFLGRNLVKPDKSICHF